MRIKNPNRSKAAGIFIPEMGAEYSCITASCGACTHFRKSKSKNALVEARRVKPQPVTLGWRATASATLLRKRHDERSTAQVSEANPALFLVKLFAPAKRLRIIARFTAGCETEQPERLRTSHTFSQAFRKRLCASKRLWEWAASFLTLNLLLNKEAEET